MIKTTVSNLYHLARLKYYSLRQEKECCIFMQTDPL